MLRVRHHGYMGVNTVLAVGMIFSGLMVATLSIDFGTYLAVQNQLQTAVDAASLAGARDLPNGTYSANNAALTIGQQNPVAGKQLTSSDFTFSNDGKSFTATAQTKIMPTLGQLFCSGTYQEYVDNYNEKINKDKNNPEQGLSVTSGPCSPMTVSASSTASPAARDTVLVIDTSSSMNTTHNGHTLLQDVQNAAKQYVNLVASQDKTSVDRIGLVTFDQTGRLRASLTSQQTSPSFATITQAINGLNTFSGSGCNTNYEQGLKYAVDELQNHGRQATNKEIIFMTDGYANLPAPPSSSFPTSYTYDKWRKCSDMVNNSSQVKALCTRNSRGQLVCPVLPSSQITDDMISQAATDCAIQYTDYLSNQAKAQADKAAQLGFRISSIRIWIQSYNDNVNAILRRLLKNPTWDPQLTHYMATATKGQEYTGHNYDPTGINQIYTTIAQDIHVKLSN